jgi:hypothetical protein
MPLPGYVDDIPRLLQFFGKVIADEECDRVLSELEQDETALRKNLHLKLCPCTQIITHQISVAERNRIADEACAGNHLNLSQYLDVDDAAQFLQSAAWKFGLPPPAKSLHAIN